MSLGKVCVVTGSDKGIGLGTVREMLKIFDGDVFLTAMEPETGLQTFDLLQKDFANVRFHQLDIRDENSIECLRQTLTENYGGLDVLINNAAINFGIEAKETFGYQAEKTLETNYFGTKRVCDNLFPILKMGARVVNVSSSLGWLSKMKGQDPTNSKLKEKLSSQDLTSDEVDKMMNDFIEAAKAGNHYSKGWPDSTYAVAKVGLGALTRIWQREFDCNSKKDCDIVLNFVNPGYVATDMNNHRGPKTIEEGAIPSTFAATLPPKTKIRGEFIWEDCTLKDWVHG